MTNKNADINITKTARIWEETVTIPTYSVPPPDPNPMFFENRVNQGASGRVYPNPFSDRVNHEEKSDREYQAVFLENEYIQLMVLPRFGGRIHAALDKTNNYDFIYRQHVIKPALIGLFGFWLSGGMEFNWPLHHRPSTFLPVEYTLEEGQDGSVTVWLSEHEPMNRMKGMVGVCVYPDRALFELKVQLFNRTPLPQPFLWWVNTAVHVNDDYQLIFPPDVESVAFHSRAYMAEYPVAQQKYAGLDWTAGVDISWPKNVAEASSYFANPSKFEFFGGYDHGKKGGIIHVASRHISPGKKLFTWGTGDFGTGWQESLTDNDGPYVELMASAYSDNQPDFTWIQPYETKTFSQIWYPIQEISGVKNANSQIAVNLEQDFVGVCATEAFSNLRVLLTSREEIVYDQHVDLAPGEPLLLLAEDLDQIDQPVTELKILDSQGNELISYAPTMPKNKSLPDTAKPPPLPHQIDSLEELFLTGLHVEQYLHFTLDPAPYWERALELDPGDYRSNNALGRLHLRRGDFTGAAEFFHKAIQTLTRYNFNPYDGEPHYNLGLAFAYQGRYDEAYDHFNKATWAYAMRASAYFAMAQIDIRSGEYLKAIEHLDRALVTNAHNNKARALKVVALRKLGKPEQANQIVNEILKFDPLDHWAHCELMLLANNSADLTRILRGDVQNYLDLAFDYAGAGLYAEASELLLDYYQSDPPLSAGQFPDLEKNGSSEHPPGKYIYPMIYYAIGYFAAQMGNPEAALDWYRQASGQPSDFCFPVRLEEQVVLEAALKANPSDERAAYYLGNLYYDKNRYEKAIAVWQTSTQQAPDFAIPWRNLGLALYNKRGDKYGAKQCYDQARAVNPDDPRLLMEMDQLLQRLGSSPSERLAKLEESAALVNQRDDLSLTMAELCSQTGQPEKALKIIASRNFHAWEGGEGGAVGQYALAHVVLMQTALDAGDLQLALEHFRAVENPPDNLGIDHGLSLYKALAWFIAGETLAKLGDPESAAVYYQKVIDTETKASLWEVQTPLAYYAALSLRALGQESVSEEKLRELQAFAQKKLDSNDQGGFYTSKPATIVFDDDQKLETETHGQVLLGLAYLGQGKSQAAAARFKAVLDIDPHNWWAHLHLSNIGI